MAKNLDEACTPDEFYRHRVKVARDLLGEGVKGFCLLIDEGDRVCSHGGDDGSDPELRAQIDRAKAFIDGLYEPDHDALFEQEYPRRSALSLALEDYGIERRRREVERERRPLWDEIVAACRQARDEANARGEWTL